MSNYRKYVIFYSGYQIREKSITAHNDKYECRQKVPNRDNAPTLKTRPILYPQPDQAICALSPPLEVLFVPPRMLPSPLYVPQGDILDIDGGRCSTSLEAAKKFDVGLCIDERLPGMMNVALSPLQSTHEGNWQ